MTDIDLHILILERVFGYERTVTTSGADGYFVEGTRIERWSKNSDKDKFVRLTHPDGTVRAYPRPSYEALIPNDLRAAMKAADKVGLFRVMCLHQVRSGWQLGMHVWNKKNTNGFIPSLEDESLPRLLCLGSLRYVGCTEVPAI